MTKQALTDYVVKNLPPPPKGQARYWDASLPGFGLRVSQGGAKTWVLLDPRSKVRTQETIGRYPLVSLQDARSEAKRRLAEQTLGKHRPRAVSWNTALRTYLAGVEKARRVGTYKERKRLLETRFKFGETKLSDLTPYDIERKLDKLSDTPSEQQHAFVAVRAFLNWAYTKHYVSESPVARLKSPHVSAPRQRVLSDDELRKIWDACEEDAFGSIVKLLMLTGQRRGEIAALTGDMIAGETITFPAWLTKNSLEHIIPVLATCMTLLVSGAARVPQLRPNEPIFGVYAKNLRKPYSAWSKNKKALDARSGVSGWTLHDLRRTFRTNLGKRGVRPDISERVVNHISSRSEMDRTYDHYNYLPEMRDALETWEAHLQTVINGPAGPQSGR